MTGFFSKLFGQQRGALGDSDDVEPKDVVQASNARKDSGLESLPVSAQLLYPGADQSVAMKTRGPYRRGDPEGAVVHYTAGRVEKGGADAVATMKYGASGFCYFCIPATGKVYQGAPLDRWGSHAGGSKWPGPGSWGSQYLVPLFLLGDEAALDDRQRGELGRVRAEAQGIDLPAIPDPGGLEFSRDCSRAEVLKRGLRGVTRLWGPHVKYRSTRSFKPVEGRHP